MGQMAILGKNLFIKHFRMSGWELTTWVLQRRAFVGIQVFRLLTNYLKSILFRMLVTIRVTCLKSHITQRKAYST